MRSVSLIKLNYGWSFASKPSSFYPSLGSLSNNKYPVPGNYMVSDPGAKSRQRYSHSNCIISKSWLIASLSENTTSHSNVIKIFLLLILLWSGSIFTERQSSHWTPMCFVFCRSARLLFYRPFAPRIVQVSFWFVRLGALGYGNVLPWAKAVISWQ